MGTIAILPIKRFAHAKQRLHPGLGPGERSDLAEAMVGDVLEALIRTPALAAVLVVTAEPRAAILARAVGAEVISDPSEQGQSAAAALGVARALELGHDRALLVPGDCPALSPAELEALLAGSASGTTTREVRPGRERGARVVIVPDRHGAGTNALLLEPPDVISPAFGPGSFARHTDRAVQAGATWEVARPESLLLDIDTGDDLDTLRAGLSQGGGAGRRTRAVLRRLTAGAHSS